MYFFSKKYKIGFFLLDREYDVVYKYEPTTHTKCITPRTLYCVWDNHHIYKLNDNLDSLAQNVHNKIHKRLMEQKYEQPQQVFSNYAMRNFEAEGNSKLFLSKT